MLRIKDLKKNFRKTHVLKGIQLEINPSERIALVGQNGCGKTTLIRCILGLYQFEGNIEICGDDVLNNRENALKHVAFVPQTPPALKNSVKEIISLAVELTGLSEKKVENLAAELGLNLSKIMDTPFKGLSGGMKQKLLIACALAREPKILIMDEPSANLDPQARAVFFRLLSELPAETTMLLTSHRVDELSGIVSRVIEIDEGVISMDDIVEARGNDYLTSEKECELHLVRIPSSVKEALVKWGFKSIDPHELIWKGIVSSADSFRFHATLTRWSGIISGVQLSTQKKRIIKNEKDIKTSSITHVHSFASSLPGSDFNDSTGAHVEQGAMCKVPDGIK